MIKYVHIPWLDEKLCTSWHSSSHIHTLRWIPHDGTISMAHYKLAIDKRSQRQWWIEGNLMISRHISSAAVRTRLTTATKKSKIKKSWKVWRYVHRPQYFVLSRDWNLEKEKVMHTGRVDGRHTSGFCPPHPEDPVWIGVTLSLIIIFTGDSGFIYHESPGCTDSYKQQRKKKIILILKFEYFHSFIHPAYYNSSSPYYT